MNIIISLTEGSFIKIPYEQYRSHIRVTQKDLEKELVLFTKTLGEFAQSNSSVSEESIKKILAKLAMVRFKIQECERLEDNLYDTCIYRLKHLNQVIDNAKMESSDQSNDSNMVEGEDFIQPDQCIALDNIHSEWFETRTDRLIADCLLREGHLQSCQKLIEMGNLRKYIDLDIFNDIAIMYASLDSHSCTECLQWIQQVKKGSFKPSVSLEFNLRLQEFIELIRQSEYSKATMYAKKNLIAFMETHRKEIRIAMAMLAIPSCTTREPYKSYFHSNRWNQLKEQFRSEIYSLYHISESSLLITQLQAGLSALKTPMCYEVEMKSVNCPICSSPLGEMAKSLPFSHHESSCMVCRISGVKMDENNPPMALPNGYIYSYQALKKMADFNNGTVQCPRTGFKCLLTELKKVFIM